MIRVVCLLAWTIGISVLMALPTLAEKRVALVIGNGAYTRVPALDNPRRDAAAMEAMLKGAGFSPVIRGHDLGIVSLRRTLREFSDVARDADVAVVFYAGHGLEVSGQNYIVPVDAVLERDLDVQDEAISLERLNLVLEHVRRLRLIILDACRDNPLARSMRRTAATRSVRSGYGDIDERSLPPNTLIAYAQRAGATADDGAGQNSPYTLALLRHLPTPGLDVELALRLVRDDVLKATGNRQEPFKYGSLGGGQLPLVAAAGQAPVIAVTREAPEPVRPAPEAAATREWRALDKTSLAELETFLARYPGTSEAVYARARLVELRLQKAREIEREARLAEQRRQAEALEREKARDAARIREGSAPRPSGPVSTPGGAPTAASLTAFQVKSNVSQGIHNMRAGAGTGHGIVASIPASSKGVMVDLASCRAPDDGRSTNRWCRANWQGNSGWVSMGGLER